MGDCRIEVVNKQCLDIIKELNIAGCFITYEQVLAVLLDRYSISNRSYIGINNPLHVPVLNWLFSIQAKINLFLSMYLTNSSSWSSVVSIADLNQQYFSKD